MQRISGQGIDGVGRDGPPREREGGEQGIARVVLGLIQIDRKATLRAYAGKGNAANRIEAFLTTTFSASLQIPNLRIGGD